MNLFYNVALYFVISDEIPVEEYFPAFVDMVKQVLDGNLDGNQFEDTLREMFGIHAYLGFTMDKVVQNIVRQLQHIVCDETCIQCQELFLEELKNDGAGGLCATQHLRAAQEQSYLKKAESILCDDNAYKLTFLKTEGKIGIEMLEIESQSEDSESGNDNDDPQRIAKWSEYVEKYVSQNESISKDIKEGLKKRPVFIPRNLRSYLRRRRDYRTSGSGKDSESDDQRDDKSKDKDKTDDSQENSESDTKGAQEESQKSERLKDSKDINNLKVEDDIAIHEGMQCKFNPNTYKMVYVVGSEDLLYKKHSLPKARQVSCLMKKDSPLMMILYE